MKILIAEDDAAISRALRDGLEAMNYFVTCVSNGAQVLPELLAKTYSLLLLDVMLPDMDGFEVCRLVRSERMDIPILILTARGALDDRVIGLDSGADDYLPKPFDFPELCARIRALLRRRDSVRATEIEVADLYIDTRRRIVRRGKREIFLTAREFGLLEALAQNEGAILSKETISERVWLDEFTSANTVEAHVKNLRRKVDLEGEQKLIWTMHGLGYSLRAK